MATPEVDICSLAIACHDTFEGFDPDSLDNNDRNFTRLVDTLCHRFNVWGDDLGVFTTRSARLDHHLGSNPEIKEQIQQNLVELLENLQLLTRKSPYTADDGPRRDAQHLISDEDFLRRVYDASERSIDQLERLGKTIRRLSPSDLQQQKLSINIEADASDERLLTLIVKNMYPFAANSLIDLLGRNVFLIYTRWHDKKENLKELHNFRTTGVELDLEKARMVQLPLSNSEVLDHNQTEETRSAFTDLVANLEGADSEPSSTASSIIFNQGWKELSDSSASFDMLVEWEACRFCLEYYRAEQFEDSKWWSRHLARHLAPYVCLAEDCANNPPQFDDLDQWKGHMNCHSPNWAETIHARDWFCDESDPEHSKHYGSSGQEKCQSLEDAEARMRKDHGESLSDNEISSIAKRNTIQQTRPLGECPICCRTIYRRTIADAPQGTEFTGEDEVVPTRGQSLEGWERESKRFRRDVSTSRTTQDRIRSAEPMSSTELQEDDISESLWNALSAQEKQDQMATHISEHLHDLAVFASKYSPPAGEWDESSSMEDFASDTVDGISEDGIVDSELHFPDFPNNSDETRLVKSPDSAYPFEWGDMKLEGNRKRRRPRSSKSGKSVVMANTAFVPSIDKKGNVDSSDDLLSDDVKDKQDAPTSDHDYQASDTQDKGKGVINHADTHTGEIACGANEFSHTTTDDLKASPQEASEFVPR